MYTTYGSSNGTIMESYERWLIKYKNNEKLVQYVNSLLKAAISEACIYDTIHENDPLNDIIHHIDQLACFSIEWDRGFRSNVPPYYALISSNCINCVLFSLFFHCIPVMLLIEPKYVNEFKWDSLRDILPFTNLKHIAIKVDDYMYGSEPENPSGEVVGKLWCLESDSYYAVVQEDHSYEEPEHGWPETIVNMIEVFCPVNETEAMAEKKREWNSQPKLSSEEACSGFIQKRKRYDEYEASKNKKPTAGKSDDTKRTNREALPNKRIPDKKLNRIRKELNGCVLKTLDQQSTHQEELQISSTTSETELRDFIERVYNSGEFKMYYSRKRSYLLITPKGDQLVIQKGQSAPAKSYQYFFIEILLEMSAALSKSKFQISEQFANVLWKEMKPGLWLPAMYVDVKTEWSPREIITISILCLFLVGCILFGFICR